jgi:hypothetical protein
LGTVGSTTISVGLIVGDENGGIAYTYEGNRIPIVTNTLWQTTTYTPPVGWPSVDPYGQPLQQISGNYNIPLVATNGNNYIYIDYLQAVDTSKTIIDREPVPNVWYVNYVDGYKIYVTSGLGAPTPTSLYLGFITAAGGTITAVDETGRTYCRTRPEAVAVTTVKSDLTDATSVYDPGTVYSLNDHIKAVGIGQLSKSNPHATSAEDLGIFPDANVSVHQQYFHSNGLLNADIAGTASAFYPYRASDIYGTASPTGNFVAIRGLSSTERLCVLATAFSSTSNITHHTTAGDSTATFSADYNSNSLASLSPATYYFYVDATSPTFPVITYAPISTPLETDPKYFIIAWVTVGGSGVISSLKDVRVFNTSIPLNLYTHFGWRPKQAIGNIGYYEPTDQVVWYDNATAGFKAINNEFLSGDLTSSGGDQVTAHGLTNGVSNVIPDVLTVFAVETGVTISSVWADDTNVHATVTAGKKYRIYARSLTPTFLPT